MSKLATELTGEINQIGEHTDTLEYKMDEMVNYVQVIEEENHTLRQSVSQLQLQQDIWKIGRGDTTYDSEASPR